MTQKDSGGAVTLQVTYTYDALDRRIGVRLDDDGAWRRAELASADLDGL